MVIITERSLEKLGLHAKGDIKKGLQPQVTHIHAARPPDLSTVGQIPDEMRFEVADEVPVALDVVLLYWEGSACTWVLNAGVTELSSGGVEGRD